MRGMVAHGEELANSNWQGHQVNLVKATEFRALSRLKPLPQGRLLLQGGPLQ
jgi:hypothetical protein